MGHDHHDESWCCCGRREFLQAAGAAGAMAVLAGGVTASESDGPAQPRKKATPTVRGAFLYPPSETLRKAGYWSWPGSGFDPEGRQKVYLDRIGQMEKKLGMRIAMEDKALDTAASVRRFIGQVKQAPPDGLFLVPFKKGHFEHVVRIVEETRVPTVVLATLGVLLSDHIRQLRRSPGVYLISATDDFESVAEGMNMIRTARWMKDARLLNINGDRIQEAIVPHLGTQVRTIPHARFYDEYARMPLEGPVRKLAEAYKSGARSIVEPSDQDILESAKCYFVFKRLQEAEHADAIMMNCLPGLQVPHRHVPPCMGFMSLRDEGVVGGCQSDLSATLSMMLVQQLFGKPGFQQNASMDTRNNLYFGSHCTCATRMNGPDSKAEPYVLRSHAEAGWGCVPRVLFPAGQEMTIAQYVPAEKPKMYVYTGKVVDCPEIPPTGGCRTNLRMTINEIPDVCDVQGMHQAIFYGNYGRQLRTYCQMFGIESVS